MYASPVLLLFNANMHMQACRQVNGDRGEPHLLNISMLALSLSAGCHNCVSI